MARTHADAGDIAVVVHKVPLTGHKIKAQNMVVDCRACEKAW